MFEIYPRNGTEVENLPQRWHKTWKLTAQMAQKFKTYPTNGTKVEKSSHKWRKSWKLTSQMAQKLKTYPTNGAKGADKFSACSGWRNVAVA